MTERDDRVRQVLLEGPPLQLAILPAYAALSRRDENLLVTNLARATGASIDLVRLDHATHALRWRIARVGIVLTGQIGGWSR